MIFQDICNRYLTEEKLVGRQLNGHFVYMNPTRDELLRIAYENEDEPGYRAIFLPSRGARGDRMYAVSNSVVHDDLKRYIVGAGIEERYHIDKCVHVYTQDTDDVWSDAAAEMNPRVNRLLHRPHNARVRLY